MVQIVIALCTVLFLTVTTWTGVRVTGQADQHPFSGPEIARKIKAWPNSSDVVTFAVIGDAGTGGKNQFRVARQMTQSYRKLPYGHLLTVGDNVYGDDVVNKAADVIDKPYKPLFDAGVEFHPTIGNHDLDDPDDLADTLATLGMPQRYYYFTDGPVDFFALDSNSMDSDQLKWLRKGLGCSDSRWQVVYMRHPLYSSGKHGSDTGLREALEPVLIKGGADVVFSGHDHNYERSTPQHGIVHIVTGGGGAKIRGVGSSEFTIVSKSELHFLLVEVTENSMEIKAINVDGLIIDSFSIEPRPGLASCSEERQSLSLAPISFS